jgi:hypothetical protein
MIIIAGTFFYDLTGSEVFAVVASTWGLLDSNMSEFHWKWIEFLQGLVALMGVNLWSLQSFWLNFGIIFVCQKIQKVA